MQLFHLFDFIYLSQSFGDWLVCCFVSPSGWPVDAWLFNDVFTFCQQVFLVIRRWFLRIRHTILSGSCLAFHFFLPFSPHISKACSNQDSMPWSHFDSHMWKHNTIYTCVYTCIYLLNLITTQTSLSLPWVEPRKARDQACARPLNVLYNTCNGRRSSGFERLLGV